MERVLGLIILGFGLCLGIEWELGPIERVDDDTGKAGKYYPVLAVSPDGFCAAVWEDRRPGHTEPFSSTRPPDGKWSTNEKVNKEPTKVNPYPSIAISKNHIIYVAWNARYGDSNTDIFVSSKAFGDTFTDPANITNTPLNCEWAPKLAVDRENTLYCMWHRMDGLFFISYSEENGWSEIEKVTDSPYADPGQHSIAIDGDLNLYTVWLDCRNRTQYETDIYFSWRPKGGAWSSNVRLNKDTGYIFQLLPEIGTDKFGNLHCIWQDTLPGGTPYIYKPTGGEWSELMRLGDASAGAYRLVVDEEGDAYCFKGASHLGLLYRPFGETWREIDMQFADDSARIGNASLKVDEKKNLYCLWSDSRYGYDIILFRMAKNVEAVGEKIKREREDWLSNPLPNPMRDFTTIKYQIDDKGYITLKIYDASGRLVKALLRAKGLEPRAYSLSWDGKDDKGKKIGNGVYFVKLETEKRIETKKIIVIK